MNSVCIIGCGDIGRRVALLWQQRAAEVWGLVRSSVEALQAAGIRPLQGDLDDAESLKDLPLAKALVYYFAPPAAQGKQDTRMQHFLAALSKTGLPRHFVALSTSGIYGDRAGGWVSETTEPRPATDRAWRRLDGETQLRQWGRQNHVPVTILRVGGIYGPGRLPLERIRQRVPVLQEELAPSTNRIHADDLARVCVAAAEKGRPDSVYNVSDGQQSNMTEYFYAVADAFGLPRPPAVGWDEAKRVMSPGMLSYLRESRRMDTRRMQEELGVTLLYPTLTAGLESIVAAR